MILKKYMLFSSFFFFFFFFFFFASCFYCQFATGLRVTLPKSNLLIVVRHPVLKNKAYLVLYYG